MFVLKVENTRGNVLTLTQNESNYQVQRVAGLNPPNAIINSSNVAGMDGSMPNGSKLAERNIVITMTLNGEIETNRLYLYKYFKTKQWCKLYYKNNSRNVYIEGYVETIENDLFQLGQTVQISVVCHDPYFKALEEIITDISEVMAGFEFPFAFGSKNAIVNPDPNSDEAIEFSTVQKNRITNVVNVGEVESGLIIELTATSNVLNPVIYNANNGREFFKVNIEMTTGDKLIINTNRSNKSVKLVANGVESNEIRNVAPIIFGDEIVYPTWFKLQLGDNEFTYSADSGSEFLNIVFKQKTLYEGV